MAKKKSKFLISPNGSLVEYQRLYNINNPKPGESVVDSFEFTGTLTFVSASRTSYSQKLSILFRDAAGATYPMFISDLSSAIPHMVNGVLTGTFLTVKRGNKAGVKLIL